jgi:peptide/nickel transport system substrate-binding protein/oligopeptide transport system substrate-binding protein
VLLSDLDLAYDQWQAGNLDWTRVPAAKEKQAIAQNPQRLIKKPTSTLWYLAAITNLTPTHSVLLRQALSLAIDRRSISAALFAGLNPPATGIFPPGMPGYRDPGSGNGPCSFCTYDQGKARSLLAAAKVPKTTTITLAYAGSTYAETWAPRVAADIQRTLGLTTQLVAKKPLSDYRAYLTATPAGLLGALSWTMNYPTPESFLKPLFGGGGEANFSRWTNSAFRELTARAHSERSDGNRTALYRDAEDVVLTQLPVIPLWWQGELRLVNLSRFTGLAMDPFGYPTLETAVPTKGATG